MGTWMRFYMGLITFSYVFIRLFIRTHHLATRENEEVTALILTTSLVITTLGTRHLLNQNSTISRQYLSLLGQINPSLFLSTLNYLPNEVQLDILNLQLFRDLTEANNLRGNQALANYRGRVIERNRNNVLPQNLLIQPENFLNQIETRQPRLNGPVSVVNRILDESPTPMPSVRSA